MSADIVLKMTIILKETRIPQLSFNRRWHISTTPHTTKKFCTLFKLIQPSNMVTLSCLAKKNQNLNPRKKKFSLLQKVELSCHKIWEISIFSNKLNFFLSGSNLFFARQLRVTILDHCISLNSVHNFLVVLGVVDMCHLLVK